MKTDKKYHKILLKKKLSFIPNFQDSFFNIHKNIKKHIVKASQKVYIKNQLNNSKNGYIIIK